MQVIGVGGGGGNAVNNMVNSDVQGVDFWVANTDVQVRICLCQLSWLRLVHKVFASPCNGLTPCHCIAGARCVSG